MNRESALEYSESLAQIGGGWWRQVLWADRQGIPAALGMTLVEWRTTYHGYLRLPPDERREAAVELTSGPEAISQRAAADVLGVSEGTIRTDLSAQNYADESPDERDPAQNYAPPEEMPIDERPWTVLMGVVDSVGSLSKTYDATSIAAAVPARKRAATAKRLRSIGTDLGRVALALERMEH